MTLDDPWDVAKALWLETGEKHYGQGHKRQTVKRAADNTYRLNIKYREV